MFLIGFLIHLPQGFRELYLTLEDLMYYLDTLKGFFLTAIWLPHGQLWAIIGEEASLTQC